MPSGIAQVRSGFGLPSEEGRSVCGRESARFRWEVVRDDCLRVNIARVNRLIDLPPLTVASKGFDLARFFFAFSRQPFSYCASRT